MTQVTFYQLDNLAELVINCKVCLSFADRQKACKKGDHECTRGQECVNYAQNENKMAMVCQCPVGNTRGADCEKGINKLNTVKTR